MTTPNQPYPAWMQTIGQGAYELGGAGGGAGGSTAYGQSITQSQVNSLIQGPATALTNLDAVTAVSDVVTIVQNYLKTQPLQSLQLFQGFLPGKSAADFSDVPTAINTIINALGLGNLSSTAADAARLMHDATILFDVFHFTYEAGTSGDEPGTLGSNGQPTWYSAWNDVLSYISKIFGITLTAPAPTIGPAITSAATSGTNGSTWSTRLTNDLTILLDVFHLTYTSAQWNAAWTDLLALFGIVNATSAPSNPAPTIGPAITSAQSSATTANTNAGTAQTTANTGLSWGQRLTNDLTTLLDVFHVTYTVTQWNAAWNDLLALFGIVNSVSTPSNPTPTIGPAITSAQAAATTANTNAGTAQSTATTGLSWGQRLTNDLQVLLDIFHLTHSSADWNAAWADLLSLVGVVNSVSAPSDPAPTTGAVIQANTATANTASTNASTAIANASAASAANQATNDAIVSATTGSTVTGSTTTQVTTGLTNIPASNVVGVAPSNVAYGAVGTGNSTNGNATSMSTSWTHTIATGDLGVLVAISYWALASATWSASVTYNGVAMTQLQVDNSGAPAGTGVNYVEVWWLPAPPSGSKTVSVSLTRTAGSGTVFGLGGNSVSYTASKVGAITPNSGGTSPASMTQTSATGRMVFGAFGARGSSISGFSQTSRYSLVGAGNAAGQLFNMGDAAGAASVTFGETISGTGGQWTGITVELKN